MSLDFAQTVNVGSRLSAMARAMPEASAVAEPREYHPSGGRRYRHLTFRQLDELTDRIAAGLAKLGVVPGTRLALLVRPGVDFIAVVFAVFKAGAVAVLIDPGLGLGQMTRCLAEAEPEGFVAVPVAQAVRILLRRRFADARFNVTVGRRWFWGGPTLELLRQTPCDRWQCSPTKADDPAAIIFTSGSTGPAKGVLYSHGNFDAQLRHIRDFYRIQPGEVDVPGFPLFGLFNCAMGVTTVVPDMDPSRPAQVDPAKFVEALRDWKATQSFGSPAIWDRVSRWCLDHDVRLDSLRRVLSAGAPVPIDVLQRMKACIHPEGDVHTPYGATEALPVASIAASEVLAKTAAQTRQGAGVCVGRRFAQIDWQVIRIVDGPIDSIEQVEPLPRGQIGELVVRGPVVTREYLHRPAANALAKIRDGAAFWHRMGDVGYLDPDDRFWFCGRKAHRVLTAQGPMYTIPCEAIFNQHPAIRRSALVGVGEAGSQTPVIVLEPHPDQTPRTPAQRDALLADMRQLAAASPLTAAITEFRIRRSLPVDVRHNVKISREALARSVAASWQK